MNAVSDAAWLDNHYQQLHRELLMLKDGALNATDICPMECVEGVPKRNEHAPAATVGVLSVPYPRRKGIAHMITSAPRPTQLKDPNDAAHDLLGRLNVHAEALDGLSIMATLSVSGESGSFPGNPNRLVTGIGAIAELLARDAWALSERFDEIEAARGQARRKVGAR